jgi:uncharacterized membrane-anchored protein
MEGILMMKLLSLIQTLGLILLLAMVSSAYLDPGTGSLIIQVLIGAVVAGGAMIKIFWKRIANFFSKK